MYSRKIQEIACPVLDIQIVLEILYEVCGTGSCQILSDVVSVSCSKESTCNRVSSEKCLLNPDVMKDYTI
jgi:hypothetical protein